MALTHKLRIGLRGFKAAKNDVCAGLRPSMARRLPTMFASLQQFHAMAELPETHEMLRKTCRDFAEEKLKPIAADLDRNHTYRAEQVWVGK